MKRRRFKKSCIKVQKIMIATQRKDLTKKNFINAYNVDKINAIMVKLNAWIAEQ